jgi:hypothetical protein
MVFPVPVADIVTLLPLTELPLASSKVTVMVAPEVLSVETEVGEAETVETLTETGPAVKVRATVLVKVMLPSVTVAVMVFDSALVDLILAVAWPLAFVVEAGWVMVFPVPVAAMVTLLSLTKLLLESRRVMVMVDSAAPSATTDDEEADMVEVVALGGPTVMNDDQKFHQSVAAGLLVRRV